MRIPVLPYKIKLLIIQLFLPCPLEIQPPNKPDKFISNIPSLSPLLLLTMSKSITFDWSENAECVIDPGDHEIRLSLDQIQMFWFLAQHGKNLVTAYRNSPQYHNHCQCCGAEMLNKMDANLEDLMFNMSMFFDLYVN